MNRKKIDPESLKLMSSCYKLFHLNQEGKALLDQFLDLYNNRTADPNKSSNHAFFQEGQRNAWLQIKYIINLYKQYLEEENKKGDKE